MREIDYSTHTINLREIILFQAASMGNAEALATLFVSRTDLTMAEALAMTPDEMKAVLEEIAKRINDGMALIGMGQQLTGVPLDPTEPPQP